MSEEARPYRHTAGDWGRHPAYEFKPLVQINDDGSTYVFCHVYLASGTRIIAQVEMSTVADKDAGFPRVANLTEMKANLALMSAAPNLLDICNQFAQAQSWAGDDPRWAELWAASREVIAKATTY